MAANRVKGEHGWSVAGLFVTVAILAAIAVVAYPFYMKMRGDARMQVLNSDIKSWVEQTTSIRNNGWVLPSTPALADALRKGPGLLTNSDAITIWPNCRYAPGSGGAAEVRSPGDFIVLAHIQPGNDPGYERGTTPIVYDSAPGLYYTADTNAPHPLEARYRALTPASPCASANGGSGAINVFWTDAPEWQMKVD